MWVGLQQAVTVHFAALEMRKVVNLHGYFPPALQTGTMLSPVAVFLLLVSTDASIVEKLTFEYEDRDTGDTLLCALCPPGTYVSSPCTHTLDTVCLPCPVEHFTQFWNFLPKCLYCSVCEGNRVVKEQCSATHNQVCECKQGHYSEDGFCIPHTQCPPGKGAKMIGDTQNDTLCETCPGGTFSADTSSSARCIKHTDCGTLQVLLPGRKWRDTVCSSCANLTDGVSGGLNMLRDILPEFFSHRKCRLSKLKRFVRLLCKKNDRPQVRALDSRALLLHYITEWTENAHTHQLRALPNVLRRSGLQSTARKVKEMLMRIEEKVSVCQNRIRFKE